MTDRAYAHDDAILQARDALTHRYVILDTETTGLNAPEVVQFGCVTSDAIEFSVLVHPLAPIEPIATTIHHITNDMVADAMKFGVYWPTIQPLLKTYRVYGYNVQYDIEVVNRTLERNLIPEVLGKRDVFDVMYCYAAFVGEISPAYGTYKWHKLGVATAACGLPSEGFAHDALADAKQTLALLKYIANQHTTWEEAIQFARGRVDSFDEDFDALVAQVTYGRFN